MDIIIKYSKAYSTVYRPRAALYTNRDNSYTTSAEKNIAHVDTPRHFNIKKYVWCRGLILMLFPLTVYRAVCSSTPPLNLVHLFGAN